MYVHDILHGTTPLPCPSWCEEPPGHGFESKDRAGNHARAHVRAFRTNTEGDLVDLVLEEVAVSNDGPIEPGALPKIVPMIGGDFVDSYTEGMDGPRARAMALAQLAAAELWDIATAEIATEAERAP